MGSLLESLEAMLAVSIDYQFCLNQALVTKLMAPNSP